MSIKITKIENQKFPWVIKDTETPSMILTLTDKEFKLLFSKMGQELLKIIPNPDHCPYCKADRFH